MSSSISFYDNDFFVIKHDEELYSEEITRLIMTNPGERVGLPFYGVGLRNRLFEMLDDTTSEDLKSDIEEQVSLYLPHLLITDMNTSYEDNSLFLKIGFVRNGEPLTDERLLTLEFNNVNINNV